MSPNASSPLSSISLLANGDFEKGSCVGWIVNGSAEAVRNYVAKGRIMGVEDVIEFSPTNPHSGSWFLILGRDKSPGVIYQKILIPKDTIQANLSFWYNCAPISGSRLDFWMLDNNGTSIKTANFILTEGWKQFTLDLDRSCFGQRLTIRFRGTGITNYQTYGRDRVSCECLTILDDIRLVVQTRTPPKTSPEPSLTPTPISPTISPTPSPKETLPTSAPTMATTPKLVSSRSIELSALVIASLLPIAIASIRALRKRRTRSE